MPTRRKNLTPDEQTKIISLYTKDNLTVSVIAIRFRIPINCIKAVLKKKEIPLRKEQGRH